MTKVLILGAGPAGSCCAISLLQTGCRNVTILDRSEFPRHAPGETLHPGIEALLKQLGVWEEVLNVCKVRQKGVEVILDRVHQKNYYNEESSWEGLQIKREYLDQLLMQRARDLGAKVFLGEKAIQLNRQDHLIHSIQTDKAHHEADCFVDASGRARWFSRMLGIKSERYGKRLLAHYGYYQNDQPLELPTISYEKDGSWLWQAQIDEQTFNWTYVHSDTALGKDWVHPVLSNKQQLAKYILDVSWKLNTSPASGNYIAIGDAAFTTDPSTSHGVLKAIMTGIMAADMITRNSGLSSGVASYNNWISKWFFTDLYGIAGIKKQVK